MGGSGVTHDVKVSPLPRDAVPLAEIRCREAYCDMKIKEKGLTGKAAVNKRESMAGPTRKGFNAFKEMAGANNKDKKGKAGKEVFLEFLGSRIRVYDEDGGTVKKEDIPFVKGTTLKWEGCEDVSFDEIKVSILVCRTYFILKPSTTG